MLYNYEGNASFKDAHFIYGNIEKDHFAREETRFRKFMSYSFRLPANDLLYAPSHRHGSTVHTTIFVIPAVEQFGTRNGSSVHHEGSRSKYFVVYTYIRSYIHLR